MSRTALRVLVRTLALAASAIAVFLAYVLLPPPARSVEFPGGKRFAFTIVDDTDQTTLERVRPLYAVMHRAGLRTTKTVWALDTSEESVPTDQGASLQDPAYREWVLELQRNGFEIALHGVRGGSSERATVIAGLDSFKSHTGSYPRLHVNHALNRDNLYWGKHRWWFAPYGWLFGLARPAEFSGHLPESPYFWGDIAQQRLTYVRRFTFSETNTLKVSPSMPYHMPGMPHVRLWFDAADGGSIEAFERTLSDANLDRLEREGGVAIVYAHLGAGSFNKEEAADPRFIARIEAVARRNGWFAPVSEILDHLAAQPGWAPEPGFREKLRLETWFLLDRLFMPALGSPPT